MFSIQGHHYICLRTVYWEFSNGLPKTCCMVRLIQAMPVYFVQCEVIDRDAIEFQTCVGASYCQLAVFARGGQPLF